MKFQEEKDEAKNRTITYPEAGWIRRDNNRQPTRIEGPKNSFHFHPKRKLVKNLTTIFLRTNDVTRQS